MKFFYDLSTKTKLLVCFTIVIAINLIISITTLTSLNQVNKAAEEIDGVLNAAFSRTFTVQEALEKTQFSFSTGLNMLYFDYDEKMLERDAPQLIADIKTRVNALNPDFLGTQEYRDLCLEVKQAALNSVKILEERVMPKIQRDAFSDANSTFTTEVYPGLARAISACSALYKIQTQHCLSLTQAASDSTIVFVDSILTVVGVIMAGRTGASFAATLGTMQVNEEIDALKTMGIPVADFLILPRLAALVLVMPLLTMLADFMGMLGGGFVGILLLDIPAGEYWKYSWEAWDMINFWVGVFHGFVFGFIIALCGCYYDVNSGRNADGVGVATTRAVVSSIVWMIVATGVITAFFERLGI